MSDKTRAIGIDACRQEAGQAAPKSGRWRIFATCADLLEQDGARIETLEAEVARLKGCVDPKWFTGLKGEQVQARIEELEGELEKALFSVRQFCSGHMGVGQDRCPVCAHEESRAEVAALEELRDKVTLALIRGIPQPGGMRHDEAPAEIEDVAARLAAADRLANRAEMLKGLALFMRLRNGTPHEWYQLAPDKDEWEAFCAALTEYEKQKPE